MISLHPFLALFPNIKHLSPSFYLYETGGAQGCGLLCSVSISENSILSHEQIYEHHSDSLYEQFCCTHLQHNPILLISDRSELKEVIGNLMASATLITGSQPHSIWHANKNHPLDIPGPLYIADGHHRYSAAEKYHHNKKNSSQPPLIMAAIFPTDQVSTRYKAVVVKNIKICQKKLLLFFDITALESGRNPENRYEFIMLSEKKWYSLKLKSQFIEEKIHQTMLSLDILKKFILIETLNIASYTNSPYVRVSFDSSNVETLLRNSDKNTIGFIAASDSSEDIINIAKQRRLLEANSTYFEPKLVSGIIKFNL